MPSSKSESQGGCCDCCRCCNCCSRKCCLITWAILIPLIVGIAILLFFIAPRIPKHSESYEGLNSYTLSSSYFAMNISFSITVDNRNYVDIKIGKSHIEVWHQNLSYVGSTDIDNIVFPKRKDTTKVLDFIFSTNDATVIANIIAEMPKKSFTLRGFIRVVYLGISLKIPLNNSFQVAMSKRDAITGALYEYIDTSKLAQTASMQQRRERAYIEKTSTSLP